MSRRVLLPILVFVAVAAVSSKSANARHFLNLNVCTPEQGQLYIDQGRLDQAIREFTCIIDEQPTEVEGYRGRIEAQLLSGQFSNAVRDAARLNAFVVPVHPDAASIIISGYSDRLSIAPTNVNALTGLSFTHWWFFQYPAAIQVLNQLLAIQPNNVYGNLFRGSTRLLSNSARAKGISDLNTAIALAPQSPDVHFIVADAYTYGLVDPQRAFDEASLALAGGLDTPRVHAILGASYNAFGNLTAAANEIQRHIELVTTELVQTLPIDAGTSFTLDLVPGRTYEIPLSAVAGQSLSITTNSNDFTDTIMVLLDADGSPVVGSDDSRRYFAGLKWVPGKTGIYRLQVTSFESVSTGELVVRLN